MTIKHPKGFFEAPPAGFDGTFHWDFLLPAFKGTKITPMDFDCVIERGGRFLVFETKNPGIPLPRGQLITLAAAVHTGLFTVIFCAKKPADINGFEVWRRYGHKPEVAKKSYPGGYLAVLDFTRQWFVRASGETIF